MHEPPKKPRPGSKARTRNRDTGNGEIGRPGRDFSVEVKVGLERGFRSKHMYQDSESLSLVPTTPLTAVKSSSDGYTIFQFHFESLSSTVRSELSRCTVVFPLCRLNVSIHTFIY